MPTGIDVIHSKYLDGGMPIFYRKPKSKKRRIIKKWCKRACNWRNEDKAFIMNVDPGTGDREAYLIVDRDTLVQIEKETRAKDELKGGLVPEEL